MLKSDNAEMAVEYIPRSNKTKDPLIPGSNIAVLAAHPDKNKTSVEAGVNDVMTVLSAGDMKAVIASKIPTISNTM